MIKKIFTALAAVLLLAAPVNAAAPKSPSECQVVDTGEEIYVTANDLPIHTLLNFFVTDANGKRGQVLGFTDTGSWTIKLSFSLIPQTYEFTSETWGKNGTKYTVYSTCARI